MSSEVWSVLSAGRTALNVRAMIGMGSCLPTANPALFSDIQCSSGEEPPRETAFTLSMPHLFCLEASDLTISTNNSLTENTKKR